MQTVKLNASDLFYWPVEFGLMPPFLDIACENKTTWDDDFKLFKFSDKNKIFVSILSVRFEQKNSSSLKLYA